MQTNTKEILDFYSSHSISYNIIDLRNVKEEIEGKNKSLSPELQTIDKKYRIKPDFTFEGKPPFFLDLNDINNPKMIEFSNYFGLFPNYYEEFMYNFKYFILNFLKIC